MAGRDATDLPAKERQIGFVFQSYALFKHMTIAENIGFGPRIQQMDIDIDKRYGASDLRRFLNSLQSWKHQE